MVNSNDFPENDKKIDIFQNENYLKLISDHFESDLQLVVIINESH